MAYIQIPRRGGILSPMPRARRAHRRHLNVPFMALLVGTVTALSVTAGLVNRYLDNWAGVYYSPEIQDVQVFRLDPEADTI